MVHDAADRPGAPQFLGRPFGVAILQRASDAGRRQRPLCVCYRRHQGQPHAQSLGPSRQKAGITAAAMAERKILPGYQMAGAQAVVQHLPNELIRRHQAEVVVERQLVQQVHTQRSQRIRAFSGKCQSKRRIIRPKHLTRMRLERQHRQRCIRPRRVRCPDDACMPEVHAIEVTERDGCATSVLRHILPIRKYPHQNREGTRTQASPSITTFSFTRHLVRRVTLFRRRFKSVISTMALTVCPIFTGARNISDWRI